LVGRQEEIKQLETHLEDVAAGKGRTVLVSGEAGIGKTRLLEELRSLCATRGFLFLYGNSMHESLTPYDPFLEALKSGELEHLFAEDVPRVEAAYVMTDTGLLLAKSLREQTELSPDIFASMLTSVEAFVQESMSKLTGKEMEGGLNTLGYENYRILMDSRKGATLVVVLTGKENEFLVEEMGDILRRTIRIYGGVLEDWDGDEESVSGIGEILSPLLTSGKYDGIHHAKGDPRARRNLLFENVSMGLARQTEESPVVLCIEDLQWADPSTLALMHYVARANSKRGILIAGTYRPEDIPAREGHPLTETMQLMDREDLFDETRLDRLSEDETSSVVDCMLGETDFDRKFRARLFRETEGNPLFIVQVVKYILEEGIIERKDGIWKLAKPLEEVAIPSKVYNVIVHRLNKVNREDRKLLDYASVNGEVFTSAVVAAAINARKADVLERLRDLEQTHKLVNPLNGAFRFDHAKIKEVLYNEIPNELRMEYHTAIGESIERLNMGNLNPVVGDLAFHYYHARNGKKALDYLVKAAEEARREYSNEEAIRFYTEALEFEEDRRKRGEILEALGDICDMVGDYDKSLGFYREAEELAEEAGKKAEINAKIGGIQWKKGEYDESVRTCEEVLDTVGPEESKLRGLALSHIGIVHYLKAENERALEYYEKSLGVREKIGDGRGIAASLNNIANIHASRGDYDKALEDYERAMRTLRDIDDQQGLSATLQNIGILYGEMEEYDMSQEYLKKALEARSRMGDRRGVAESLSNIGDVFLQTDEYDEALENYRKSVEIAERIGQKLMMAYNIRPMAEAHIRKGDLQKALDLCTRALELAKEVGNKEIAGNALRNIAMVRREQARWDESIKDFEKSLSLLGETESPRGVGLTNYEFGLMWTKRGDVGRAKLHLGKALEIFTELRWEKKIGEVREALRAL
jgi:predicted ATPase